MHRPKTISIKAAQILLPVIGIALIIMGVQPMVLADEGPSDLDQISPKVSIPEKNLNRARQLIKLEPYGKQIFMNANGIELPEPKDFTEVEYELDNKNPDIVIVRNDYVLALAKSLDACAGEHIAKSEYTKAKELLNSAIEITKDTGRNATELERYQTEYDALLRRSGEKEAELVEFQAKHPSQ